MLPFLENIERDELLFQQDYAPAHSASTTKECFLKHNITVLKWPARSADVNPIKKMWGNLSLDVYADGKEYNDAKEVKDAISY